MPCKSHDSIVKKTLSDKKIANSFLRHHLPLNVQLYFKFETLRLAKDSFVDDTLSQSFTDVLYSMKMVNGKKGFVYVLIEHQRKPDPFIVIRVERYKADIMLQHIQVHKTRKAPVVYPLVLYNGKYSYKCETDYYSIFEDPVAAKEIMRHPLQLIDLTQFDDDSLLKHKWHGVVEVILKHREVGDFFVFFEKLIQPLILLDVTGSSQATTGLINYLISQYEVDDIDRLHRLIIQNFQPKTSEKIMTGAETLIQRGIEQGIEQGIGLGVGRGREEGRVELIQRMLENGLSLSQISQCTSISEQELEALCQRNFN